jgi:hypothetical protein
MPSIVKVAVMVIGVVLVAGCAHSPTEEDFGNSVHHIIAKQQMPSSGPLQDDEPLQSTDGRRGEKVATVYQTTVGDPGAVVRSKGIQSGAGK